jgi:O-antigen/teichoic acid export membrane protein
MSIGKKIIKNTFILTSGQVLSKILNLILLLILTRMLGKNGFGLYSFALAFGSMFILFSHLGINTLLVRDIAQDKSKATEYINITLSSVLVFSLFTFLIINITAYLSGWDNAERLIIFIISIYVIFDSISRYLNSIFRAFEKMEYEAIVIITDRIGLLVCTLIVWFFDSNLNTLLIGFSLIGFIKALTAFLFVRRHFTKPKLKWSINSIFPILKEAYPFALVGLFGSIALRIDTVILKHFHTDEMVGIYNAGKKLIESLSFLPENIYYAIFPTLSAIFVLNKSKFDQTFYQAFKFMIIFAIPTTVGIFTLAPQIVSLLFEPDFYDAYIPLRWLSIALGILFCRHILAVTLNSAGKQHLFAAITGISMLANVLLNYILIPQFSYIGASIATITSEALTTIITYFVLKRLIDFSNFRIEFFKLLLAGSALTFAMYYLHSFNIIIAISISIIIYGSLLLGLGILTTEERQFFVKLLREKLILSK